LTCCWPYDQLTSRGKLFGRARRARPCTSRISSDNPRPFDFFPAPVTLYPKMGPVLRAETELDMSPVNHSQLHHYINRDTWVKSALLWLYACMRELCSNLLFLVLQSQATGQWCLLRSLTLVEECPTRDGPESPDSADWQPREG
jgi:hypothetical protein